MTKPSAVILIISIVFSSYMMPASADWGSLFKDLKSTGQSLLSNSDSSATTLDNQTIISGLKQALDIGTRHAIDNVSQPNGYLANELIHIAMPPQLQQVDGLMRKFGLDAMADQFEQSMNHAAEKAAPEATNIIVNAIKNMTIDDAKTILNGEDDAATDYFKQQTSDKLTALFRPVITDSLNQVGTTKYYNDLTGQLAAVPFVGETVNLDLPDYVTQQALNGMFTMIAAEEKKIRQNPAARTTELLKKVFQNQ
ncbi:MAG: DUF4197 domain-containing protein [Gammaproteobacteria bacterium]|nr:DUF4197 domain-containing protein [Gammaproteobacteria bacterium]